MHFSDLHIHSSYSDGILTPNEIITIADKKNIKYISITDHDTVDSQTCIEHFQGPKKVSIIPGIELSTEYQQHEIHILGYFIDINNYDLKNALCSIKQSRIDRIREIINTLNRLDITISIEDIAMDKYISIGRPHIARVLVEKGYALNIKEAFTNYLMKGKPAFIERYKIAYKDAMQLIVQSGGIVVLAHPGELYKGLDMNRLIRDFKVYGLKGLEVFHPSHSDTDISKFYNIAKKYNLIITGGSDYHGFNYNSNIEIGSVGINEDLTQKLFKIKNKLGG
jgi:3',5'-nucleoside bisphosphate phosphatase